MQAAILEAAWPLECQQFPFALLQDKLSRVQPVLRDGAHFYRFFGNLRFAHASMLQPASLFGYIRCSRFQQPLVMPLPAC